MKINQHESDTDTRLAANWQAQAETRRSQASLILSLGYEFGTVYYATKTRREVRESNDEILTLAREALAAGTVKPYDVKRIENTLARYAEGVEDIERLKAEAAPDEAEYNEKQWSRFFLVTNSNGHIHSSMNCSTCHITTAFAWLPDLSGLTEKDAVDAHGPHLCTVCFPSAPVEWTVGTEKDTSNQCPGSKGYDYQAYRQTSYTGSGRAECSHCGQTIGTSTAGRMRTHDKKEN